MKLSHRLDHETDIRARSLIVTSQFCLGNTAFLSGILLPLFVHAAWKHRLSWDLLPLPMLGSHPNPIEPFIILCPLGLGLASLALSLFAMHIANDK